MKLKVHSSFLAEVGTAGRATTPTNNATELEMPNEKPVGITWSTMMTMNTLFLSAYPAHARSMFLANFFYFILSHITFHKLFLLQVLYIIDPSCPRLIHYRIHNSPSHIVFVPSPNMPIPNSLLSLVLSHHTSVKTFSSFIILHWDFFVPKTLLYRTWAALQVSHRLFLILSLLSHRLLDILFQWTRY